MLLSCKEMQDKEILGDLGLGRENRSLTIGDYFCLKKRRYKTLKFTGVEIKLKAKKNPHPIQPFQKINTLCI